MMKVPGTTIRIVRAPGPGTGPPPIAAASPPTQGGLARVQQALPGRPRIYLKRKDDVVQASAALDFVGSGVGSMEPGDGNSPAQLAKIPRREEGFLPPGATIGMQTPGSPGVQAPDEIAGSMDESSSYARGCLPQGAVISARGLLPPGATIPAPKPADDAEDADAKLETLQRLTEAQGASTATEAPQLLPQFAALLQAQMLAAATLSTGGPELQNGAEPAVDSDIASPVNPELAAVQQAQVLQQYQFHEQLREFEKQSSSSSSSPIHQPQYARFKAGHRPMQLCKKFFNLGHCFRGDQCTFAHAVEELHPASKDIPAHMQEQAQETWRKENETEDVADLMPTLRMKKKREMCQRLKKSGCLLGSKCMFAHSESELGTVALVIVDGRVRTAICKFWEQGKCLYGQRYCLNAHGMDMIGTLKPPESVIPMSI